MTTETQLKSYFIIEITLQKKLRTEKTMYFRETMTNEGTTKILLLLQEYKNKKNENQEKLSKFRKKLTNNIYTKKGL